MMKTMSVKANKEKTYVHSLQLTKGERGFFDKIGSCSGDGRLAGFNSESELRQKYQTSVAAEDLS
jgi:hypothetical protein